MAVLTTTSHRTPTTRDPMDLTTVSPRADLKLLQYALTRFCKVPNDGTYYHSNIVRALSEAGITGFFELISLKDENFAQLQYPHFDARSGWEWRKLSVTEASALHLLKAAWNKRSHELGVRADISHPDHFPMSWFHNYRIDGYNGNEKIVPWTHRDGANQALQTWKKITKPSAKDIPKFSDEAYWFRYNEHMKVSLDAGGLLHVIDSKYVPPAGDELLFEAQKRWFYKALMDTVTNGRALRILREHQDDKDTQAIWQEFEDDFGGSVTCQVRKQELGAYLMCDCKFITLGWKGKVVEYLAHFNEKVREYQSLSDADGQFSDLQLVNMLNNAVTGVHDLQGVLNNYRVAAKAASGVMGSSGVATMRYEELLEALMHQAQIIDASQDKPKSGYRAQQHEFDYGYGDDEDDEMDDGVQANVHNINTDIDQLVRPRGAPRGTHARGRRDSVKVFNVVNIGTSPV